MKGNKQYRRYGICFEPEVVEKAREEAKRRGVSLNAIVRSALCRELQIPHPEVRAYRIRKVKVAA